MQLKHNFPAPDPLSDLKARLAAGLERYNGGGTRNRRRGAIWQMMAIIDYLRFQGFASVGHLRPAYEMVSSLGDLEDGKQASWLRPDRTKKGGSPPSSTSREMLREDVAVSVSILMDGGMSEPLANQHVARKLGNLGLKKSAHTAGNWRSEVMAYLPAGVGVPGRPDKPIHAGQANHQVWQYLHWWQKWRASASLDAMAFVDRRIGPEMARLIARE